MQYLLALDQGTTSSRAILFDRDGNQCALAQREFQQFYPQQGWVEHDADEIWQTQLTVAQQVVAEVGVASILAIGITNQRETCVLWDRRTGRPLHRAIVWQDRRTASMCDTLKARGLEALFRARTGLLLDPYFSGSKLAWLLDNIDGARKLAEDGALAFGTIDSWLLRQLTGGRVHATDVTNASADRHAQLPIRQWVVPPVPRRLQPCRVTRWKARCLSAVPRCNGCAMALVLSRPPRRSKHWLRACRIAAA